ncbi:MAG: N-acetylglucosamine-6-phosphate deacetylase [Lactobacillales bacterium]|jgi:N-acetylglucosamine-6-phosphate deacetylase|nr:N-acetylglucosamine-6-phosphate deacetylase [Lactobacillales bacterium]
MKAYKAHKIFTGTHEVTDGYLVVDNNGEIVEVTTTKPEKATIKNFKKGIITPGFVDTHIHGFAGVDTMDGDIEKYRHMLVRLAQEGTTSVILTTVTSDDDHTREAVRKITELLYSQGPDEAKVQGIYLEGPFISPDYKGAHDEKLLRELDIKFVEELQMLSGGLIKKITIAPELEGAESFIHRCKIQGIHVSIGHTNATTEQVERAVEIGADFYTHVFNAMKPFNHRDVGVVGAVLNDKTSWGEVIADGVHVNLDAIKILLSQRGIDRTILITDSMRGAGMPDGDYELGGLDVVVKDGEAHNVDGTLAGSTLILRDAVKNMQSLVSLNDSIKMATYNAAIAHSINGVGLLAKHKAADFIVFDEELNIQKVYINGELINENSKSK